MFDLHAATLRGPSPDETARIMAEARRLRAQALRDLIARLLHAEPVPARPASAR